MRGGMNTKYSRKEYSIWSKKENSFQLYIVLFFFMAMVIFHWTRWNIEINMEGNKAWTQH